MILERNPFDWCGKLHNKFARHLVNKIDELDSLESIVDVLYPAVSKESDVNVEFDTFRLAIEQSAVHARRPELHRRLGFSGEFEKMMDELYSFVENLDSYRANGISPDPIFTYLQSKSFYKSSLPKSELDLYLMAVSVAKYSEAFWSGSDEENPLPEYTIANQQGGGFLGGVVAADLTGILSSSITLGLGAALGVAVLTAETAGGALIVIGAGAAVSSVIQILILNGGNRGNTTIPGRGRPVPAPGPTDDDDDDGRIT